MIERLQIPIRATLLALTLTSFGGWIAAAFAIAHPQKVDKLALVPGRRAGDEKLKGGG
jgi:pimeloyl-ACP methyl ester carboxylesterase